MSLKQSKVLALAALLWMIPFAANADKISELPAGAGLGGTEVAPFVQGGTTVKTTANQISTFVSGNIVDSSITEPDLNAIDSPVDEDCLTYEGGNFEWQTCGGVGGAQTPWTSNIDADTFDLLDVGDLVVGSGTKLATFSGPTTPSFQVPGITADTAAIGIARFSNSVGEASLQLAKSRGTTVGSYTIAADGDTLGTIMFEGADGTDFASAAGMEVLLNGTPGANDMPGLMVFRTSPDGSADPDNQMWIDHNGVVYIANNNGSVLDPISAFGASSATPTFQIAGITANRAALGIARFSNVNGHPTIRIAKSRGTTHASYTISQSGDGLGEITFEASDGTDFGRAAAISAYLNGTPASAGDTSDTPGLLVFATSADGTDSPTDRWAINAAGRLAGPLASTALATFDGSQTPAVQVLGLTHDDAALAMARFGANAFSPVLSLAKSRGATVGSYTVVNADDQLGNYIFEGSDGNSFEEGAGIKGFVDGTASDGIMPGRLIFSTTTTAGVNTNRWRIGSDGVFSGPAGDAGQALFGGGTTEPSFQVLGLATGDSSIAQVRYSANAFTSIHTFAKSRGATVGSMTIVADNDTLGAMLFAGADGTNFDSGAEIRAEVDGTPSAGADMPSRIVMLTSAEASASPTQVMTLTGTQNVIVGTYTGTAFSLGPNDAGISKLQVLGLSNAEASIGVARFSNDAFTPHLSLAKSCGTAIGTMTAVTSGDNLGEITFSGADGDQLYEGAAITSAVDTTVANDVVPANLQLRTGASHGANTRLTIKSDGVIYTDDVAFLTARHDGATPFFNVRGITAETATSAVTKYGADTTGSTFILAKSRNASNDNTTVSDGDTIGSLIFMGSDNSDFEPAAAITANVNGSPSGSATDMPGELMFYTTPNDSATLTLRARIGSNGGMNVGTSTSNPGANGLRVEGRFSTASTTETIATGAIAIAQSYIIVDTEAAAATDDLDTITFDSGLDDGSVLYIRAANSARTVVVKDGTNIKGPGDCTLDNEEDIAQLLYDTTLDKWLVVACGNNGV